MTKFVSRLIVIVLGLFISIASAQQGAEPDISQNTDAQIIITEQSPEVGKHVMANMDASSMILSLFMVLAVIIISALVLKRFNFVQQNTNQLKVVASLSLGAKERVVVVQIAEQQLVLGVTAGQITLIDSLTEPLTTSESSLPVAGNVLAFFKKASNQSVKDNKN